MMIINALLSVTVVLFLHLTQGVFGFGSTYCGTFPDVDYCSSTEYCCDLSPSRLCCPSVETAIAMEGIALLIFFIAFCCCCCVVCYRCCCRRTTNQGFVYSQAGTTAVSVTLPPQQGQHVPYPTVVPYPQQTPYPPQHPTNPYYGMPPPPYGVAMQSDSYQTSGGPAPNAPYPQS